MLLLIDIGNTHTHLGLANDRAVIKHANVPTASWGLPGSDRLLRRFIGARPMTGAALCSVVPAATPQLLRHLRRLQLPPAFELTHRTLRGVGLNYPNPSTIGQDRLANALAVRHHYGAPSVAIDFGTAVTFDVVDKHGDYAGGIIAPGLAAMTHYLHEKTALLPYIKIQEVTSVIGKSTREAMLVGAVHGYRGLIHQLTAELKKELGYQRLPVVATGGYAELLAAKLPDITAVEPRLTLEGLRLAWEKRAC